jgi:restriction endonuclease S subunit
MNPVVKSELKYYAVRVGAIGKKIDPYSNQHRFRELFKLLGSSGLKSKKLKDLSVLIFSGTTPKSGGDAYICNGNGIPFIRSGEITEDGSISNEIELYIKPEIHTKLMARSQLQKNDLLIAIVGATIGKIGIFERDTPANINQAIAGVRLDPSRINPRYVLWFLKSALGQAQLDFLKRPVARANINLDEIGELLIPYPSSDTQTSLEIQKNLVDKIENAKLLFSQKMESANALIQGLDEYALKMLNFTFTNIDQQMIFAITRSAVIGKRLDPQNFQPFYSQKNSTEVKTKLLKDIAFINQNHVERPKNDDDLVPYVGLPQCDINTVRYVTTRPFNEVKGRNTVKNGDILFARIEPSVFNKKYVLVEDLGEFSYAYTSTEFYVVRANEQIVNQSYLYSIFFSSFVFNQIKGKTMGSTGRRRIDLDLFSELKIPYPSRNIQNEIAEEVGKRRRDYALISKDALQEWNVAQKNFEDELMRESKELVNTRVDKNG